MPSTPEPHTVGRHLLGPHVVGQRVVVRHVVRGEVGPSGGPALNDVLGVCRSWGSGPGGLVVLDSDRGRVEVAIADIVSGKPVPPRPSVRHRDSPRTVELHTHALWPDLETEALGEWVLRSAPASADGRSRRRANSALAMGDPGLPLAEAADRVRTWYVERGRPPIVMAVADSEVESGLLALGWRDLGSGAAHCQVAGVARVLRGLDSARPPGDSARPPEVTLDEEGDRVTVGIGDGTAIGRATLDGDWVVLDAIAADPDHRPGGLGTRVLVQLLAELLDWAASRGALTAMLQVESDDAGALGLCEGLGFVTHHTYRYLLSDPGLSDPGLSDPELSDRAATAGTRGADRDIGVRHDPGPG